VPKQFFSPKHSPKDANGFQNLNNMSPENPFTDLCLRLNLACTIFRTYATYPQNFRSNGYRLPEKNRQYFFQPPKWSTLTTLEYIYIYMLQERLCNDRHSIY